jgi:hypothetical protein
VDHATKLASAGGVRLALEHLLDLSGGRAVAHVGFMNDERQIGSLDRAGDVDDGPRDGCDGDPTKYGCVPVVQATGVMSDHPGDTPLGWTCDFGRWG